MRPRPGQFHHVGHLVAAAHPRRHVPAVHPQGQHGLAVGQAAPVRLGARAVQQQLGGEGRRHGVIQPGDRRKDQHDRDRSPRTRGPLQVAGALRGLQHVLRTHAAGGNLRREVASVPRGQEHPRPLRPRRGDVVGITHFFKHPSTSGPDVCYLQDLFTAPEARGRVPAARSSRRWRSGPGSRAAAASTGTPASGTRPPAGSTTRSRRRRPSSTTESCCSGASALAPERHHDHAGHRQQPDQAQRQVTHRQGVALGQHQSQSHALNVALGATPRGGLCGTV